MCSPGVSAPTKYTISTPLHSPLSAISGFCWPRWKPATPFSHSRCTQISQFQQNHVPPVWSLFQQHIHRVSLSIPQQPSSFPRCQHLNLQSPKQLDHLSPTRCLLPSQISLFPASHPCHMPLSQLCAILLLAAVSPPTPLRTSTWVR